MGTTICGKEGGIPTRTSTAFVHLKQSFSVCSKQRSSIRFAVAGLSSFGCCRRHSPQLLVEAINETVLKHTVQRDICTVVMWAFSRWQVG